MRKLSLHCKYIQLLYANLNSLNLIHTSKNPGIPNLAREETSNEPDYLNCLRPAKFHVADESELAGQPRSIYVFEGIRPEIFEKWNQKPKIDKNKQWNKLLLFI